MDVVENILYPESNRSNALWSHRLPARTQNLIIFAFLRRKGALVDENLMTIPEVSGCPGINQEFLRIGVKFDLVGEWGVS